MKKKKKLNPKQNNAKLLKSEPISRTVSNAPGTFDVSVGLTPSKMAALLKAAENGKVKDYLDLAERMEEKDPQYVTVLNTRKRQVEQLPITIENATHQQDKAYDLVKDLLDDGIIQESIYDMLDAIGKGFSLTEIMWQTTKDLWKPKKLIYVDPQKITVDQYGEFYLLSENNSKIQLPDYKFIPLTIKAKSGLAVRSGIARTMAWIYMFKNFDMKSWMEFTEIYGQPLRIGKFNGAATEEDKNTLLRAVSSISRDAAAIIPNSMSIDFIDGSKQKGEVFQNLIDYLDLQTSKLVLGQTTTTDAVSGGHAVSKEHNLVRMDIERADASQVSKALNRYLIKPYIDFNLGPQESYPLVKIARPEDKDIQGITDSVVKLAGQGIPISKTWFYNNTGIQPPEDDDDHLISTKPQEQTIINDSAASNDSGKHELIAARANTQPDNNGSLNQLTNQLGDEFEELNPMADIIEEIQSADSFEDMQTAINQRAKESDPDQVDKIGQALFAARSAGEVSADIEDQ